jgi:RNA polymerase sigma-70 factor (ECF subfamily)
MSTQSLRDRFNTSKEELAKLGSEFYTEALPLLEKLYNTSFWILLNQKSTRKIIKQTYFEAIENCDITKANAEWQSWIHRILMREILEFYTDKENDTKTNFDFIDLSKVSLEDIQTFSNSTLPEKGLITLLGKLPAVLRIPMILKEIHLLDYEKIAELIDVPIGVIATRIYRARKLQYLFLRDNFDYEEQKKNRVGKGSSKMIFDLRRCTLLVDDELTVEQKLKFNDIIKDDDQYKAEIFVQRGIKKLFINLSSDSSAIRRMRAKIERIAVKRFGEQN